MTVAAGWGLNDECHTDGSVWPFQGHGDRNVAAPWGASPLLPDADPHAGWCGSREMGENRNQSWIVGSLVGSRRQATLLKEMLTQGESFRICSAISRPTLADQASSSFRKTGPGFPSAIGMLFIFVTGMRQKGVVASNASSALQTS